MANGNTCAGADNTAPPDILEGVRQHILNNPDKYGKDRVFYDTDDICLLEMLGGERCQEDENDRKKDLCACTAALKEKIKVPGVPGQRYTSHKRVK